MSSDAEDRSRPSGGTTGASGPGGASGAGGLGGLLDRGESELEMLERQNDQLRMQLEALRGDFSARIARQEEEIRVQRAASDAARTELEALREELREARAATKHLKSQNLELQHRLNAWGIPVSSGSDLEGATRHRGLNRFFPPVVATEPGVDPAPIVLRGDLSIFPLSSLLGFLQQNGLVGVLTVVSETTVTKLFVEDGALRLVAWNNRDPEFGLPSLLVESELLRPAEAVSYREEDLYDFEIASRLLYEGKLDQETLRECLREHTRVIITRLFQVTAGAFFFQDGRPTSGAELQFHLSVTDILLRTAAHVDEETRELPDLEKLEKEFTTELDDELEEELDG